MYRAIAPSSTTAKRIFYISIIFVLIPLLFACSETTVLLSSRIPSSLVSPKVITLPFAPDEVCYSSYSQTFLLLSQKDNVIYRLDQQGKIVQRIGEFGFKEGQFLGITDIAVDGMGNLFVIDRAVNKIIQFDEMGQFVNSITFEEIIEPGLIAVRDNGELLIIDTAQNELFSYNHLGELRFRAGKFSILSPIQLSTSNDASFVLDGESNSILIFDNFGGIIGTLDSKEIISAIYATKDLLYYCDKYAQIFCYKVSSGTLTELHSSGIALPSSPNSIIVYGTNLGIVEKDKLYTYEFQYD
ncbi:MAG: 6-bladed beta-propeller [Candidatus Cloacimonadia bacterium]